MRRPIRSLVPLLALHAALAASPPAPRLAGWHSAASHPGGDDVVESFERDYKRYRDTPSRVEAILALEEIEFPRLVDALLPVLREEETALVEAAVRVLGGFSTRAPVERLLERLEGAEGDTVRIGILRSLARGGYAGVAESVRPGLEDSSWNVRRWSIYALAAGREPAAVAEIVPLAGDREVAVRCAALEALAGLGAQEVLPLALRDLEHEVWQVRAAAIAALGEVRDLASIGPLVARMEVEEGRLVADIATALAAITARDYGLDVQGWKRFWELTGDRFQLPTEEELARLEERRAQRAESYHQVTSYHGIETPSRALFFVIDVSASMAIEVPDRAALEARGLESFRRIDVVKAELIRTIDSLDGSVSFNIAAFASEVDTWKRGLTRATSFGKEAAKRWVSRLEPEGVEGQTMLTRSAGKTNTFAALMTGLEAGGRGLYDRKYQVAVDTIFLLSDGAPSVGEFVFPEDILREVKKANRLRRVAIHALAIGVQRRDFLSELARENGGRFVDLGE